MHDTKKKHCLKLYFFEHLYSIGMNNLQATFNYVTLKMAINNTAYLCVLLVRILIIK